MLTIITILFSIGYVILILYYLFGWIKKDKLIKKSNDQSQNFYSVIIPARNEEKNIANCIESIVHNIFLKERFEIIVVNDHSIDKTAEIVSQFKDVKLINLGEYKLAETKAFKKQAINIGINNSKGNIIVTTDADCIVPINWLKTIDESFTKNTVALVLPVVFSPTNTFLSIFQALDFSTLQGITGAGIKTKLHYMCNGANFAYRKDVFESVNGFNGIDHLPSGDDMLLLHKIKKAYPNGISYAQNKNAIVKTLPEKTWPDFFNQRIRWASKTNSYDKNALYFILAFVYIFHLLLVLNLGLGFFTDLKNFLFQLLAKIVVEFIFLITVARFFSQNRLLIWFIFLQPFHIVYTLITGLFGLIGKYSWKGRTIN